MSVEHASSERLCSKCYSRKGESEFSFRNRKRGLLRAQCKACDALEKSAYLANPESKAKVRAYKDRTRERERAYERERRQRNRDRHLAQQRRHRQTEAAKQQRREYLSRPEVRKRVLDLRRQRRAELYRTSVAYQINGRMSSLIRRSVKTGKNSRSWRSLVDWSIEEFKMHIERQFTDGMDWDAFLQGEIHIDHIRPLASFNYADADDPQFRACWGLPNLRPLWAAENHRKRHRAEFLL